MSLTLSLQLGRSFQALWFFVGMTVPELSKAVGSCQSTGVLGVPKRTDTVMSSGKLTMNGLMASAVGQTSESNITNISVTGINIQEAPQT